eukprot:6646193-Prorocentrum_lima.AAC.1
MQEANIGHFFASRVQRVRNGAARVARADIVEDRVAFSGQVAADELTSFGEGCQVVLSNQRPRHEQ